MAYIESIKSFLYLYISDCKGMLRPDIILVTYPLSPTQKYVGILCSIFSGHFSYNKVYKEIPF